jgi:hypothetical protein
MTIKKLRKIKDENIISSVEKRVRVSFFFMAASFFSISLSFYQMEKPNLHIPTSLFVSFIKLEVLSKVDNLYLNSTITLSYI